MPPNCFCQKVRSLWFGPRCKIVFEFSGFRNWTHAVREFQNVRKCSKMLGHHHKEAPPTPYCVNHINVVDFFPPWHFFLVFISFRMPNPHREQGLYPFSLQNGTLLKRLMDFLSCMRKVKSVLKRRKRKRGEFGALHF